MIYTSFRPILFVIVLSLFSTSVMSYIALATPIGPWIAPTLVLLGSLLLRLALVRKNYDTTLALITAGGSVGGIVATACGFSFPTLYFLDQPLFMSWLSQPLYFVFVMASLVLVAGSFGFLIADMMEKKCIVDEQMAFPIGQLVYKMIAAQNQIRKAYELLAGIVSAAIFSLLQLKLPLIGRILPSNITLLPAFSRGALAVPALAFRLDTLPMLLAIGFVTGYVIAIPLAVGALAKIICIDPVNKLFFSSITSSDFVLAFCSGMVLIGAVQSFIDIPSLLKNVRKGFKNQYKKNIVDTILIYVSNIEVWFVLVLLIAFFSINKFSLLEQIFVMSATFMCVYQIVVIAGKIGLAQLGRFATFVMVPALFLFGIDFVKLTLIAAFVEISGGVAVDVLFGRKMAHMANINRSQIRMYQYVGLLISALSIGVIFYLLIMTFGLGSEQLFAQRAQARALLINIRVFDLMVLAIGCLFGWLLKKIKMNPMLVLGGILMPINYSLSLILGGMLALCVRNREEWEPFWSGVFAANSIAELMKTLL